MTQAGRYWRDAQLAHVLARAVRDGDLYDVDALRVIRHEMRRHNINKKLSIRWRSAEAERVIAEYAAKGQKPPANGSPEALHADHVWALVPAHLHATLTVEDWADLLARYTTDIVVVTAAENYRLEQIERTGVDGPEKYPLAGVTWSGPTPMF